MPEVCRTLGISEQDLGDEMLDGEIFYSLKEAQMLIERWRQHYNTVRRTNRARFRTVLLKRQVGSGSMVIVEIR